MLGNLLSWSFAIKDKGLELRQSLSVSRTNNNSSILKSNYNGILSLYSVTM